MKVYYYTPEEVGIGAFPSGCISLKGDFVEIVQNQTEADCFVMPPDLSHVPNEKLWRLPYLAGNERRHVFFSICENPQRAVGIPAIIFRTDFNKHLLQAGDTTTLTWPWGSENYYKPATGFKYDVCFQGWRGMTDLVKRSCDSVKRTSLRSHIQINTKFFGTLESSGADVSELRRTYLESMWASKLLLVPQSHPCGVLRYKFYECMSAGRVPVIIGDASIPALSNKIDYSRCSLQIQEKDVDRTGDILVNWINKHRDEEIIAMGEYGHKMWERWLDDDFWEFRWSELVKERLGQL